MRPRDDDFLARLVGQPRATVEAETGLRFPVDYRLHVHERVHVHEVSATDAHLVLPPKPELSQHQLEQVAGGGCSWLGDGSC